MGGIATNKNEKVLMDFAIYCAKNPDMRFWQALTSWSGYSRIMLQNIHWDGKCSENDPRYDEGVDPYYWERRDG